jgi:hypothetical protein
MMCQGLNCKDKEAGHYLAWKLLNPQGVACGAEPTIRVVIVALCESCQRARMLHGRADLDPVVEGEENWVS